MTLTSHHHNGILGGSSHKPRSKNCGNELDFCRRNVFGEELTFEIREHSPGQCQEFVVAAPRFNYRKWLTLTLVFSLLSLGFDVYIDDARVLCLVFSLLGLAFFRKLGRKIKTESLLVISALGLQHTTTYASGRQETIFMDKGRVRDVVIAEGASMHRFLFYLVVVLRGHDKETEGERNESRQPEMTERSSNLKTDSVENSPRDSLSVRLKLDHRLDGGATDRITTNDVVYPLFQSLWPRLEVLKVVYAGVQNTLYKDR